MIKFKTQEEIAADIIQRMLARSSELTAVESGDPLRVFIQDGTSASMQDLYRNARRVWSGASLAEAVDEEAERIGRDWGVVRMDPEKSSGILRFTGSSAPATYVEIAKNTRYWRVGPNGQPVYYVTTADVADLISNDLATGGASSYIEKTGAGWVNDAYQDATVNIISGTGSGQARRVEYNTSTRLYVTDNWTTPPDGTSRFDVVTGKVSTAGDVFGAGLPGAEIPAEAQNEGTTGNCISGVITYFTSLPSPLTAVTNPSAFTGGQDKEELNAYTRRIAARRASNCGMSTDGIVQRVLEFTDTTGLRPIKSANASVSSGVVDIYIDNGTGDTSDDLVENVQAWVDGEYTDETSFGVGAAGISRTVAAATNYVFLVKATLTLRSGTDPTSAQAAAKQSIRTFMSIQKVGGEDGYFYPRELMAAISDGVTTALDIDLNTDRGTGSYSTDISRVTVADYQRVIMNEDPIVTVV